MKRVSSTPRSRSAASRGVALMEVLLALALFVAAAAVVTSALNSSLESLERQRLGVHALNLASSTLAEIQLGIRPLAGEGKQAFTAPFQDWSWELLVTPMESEAGESAAGMVRAEVIVRHQTAPIVQRLAQALQPVGGGVTNSLSTAAAP
jgi:type II secretory pathway pseudopilin PulG